MTDLPTSPASELQRTWALAAADADAAMDLFYATLFDMAPEARPLFSGVPMPDQKKKLAAAISLVVKSPDLPPSITCALQEMGRRHTGYGVEDAHYDALGAPLIETLATALGSEFTPAARTAWTDAYGAVAGHMKAGAAGGSVIAAE